MGDNNMNVDIYESPFITANSALSMINPLPITNACSELKEELDALMRVKERILEAKSYASRDNFYVEGLNIEERLEINCTNLQKIILHIEDYINYVENALTRAIDQKQIELNEQAKREETLLIAKEGANL